MKKITYPFPYKINNYNNNKQLVEIMLNIQIINVRNLSYAKYDMYTLRPICQIRRCINI